MIFDNKLKNSYLSYFLMYQFYYFSWALFYSLISVYLLDKGYSATEVSIVLSVSFLFSMITQPIIGYFSDISDAKIINIILLLVACFGGIAFMMSKGIMALMLSYGLVISIINGTNPVIEKMATTSRFSYGKIRIWGTIGYATGTQFAGVVYENISPQSIFVFFVISMVITIIGLYGTENKKLQGELAIGKSGNNKGYFHELFKNKKYLFYLLIAGIFFGVTNVSNAYIPAMFEAEGVEVSFISFIIFIAVLCEAPIVFFSNKFMEKITNKGLLIIAFLLIIFQYFCYTVTFPLQIQIIVTFLTKHVAGILFIMINLKIISTIVDSKYQITALALVATISKNLSTIIFQNISGFILDNYSFKILFLILMVISIMGLILVMAYRVPSGNDKKLFN